MSSVVRGHQNTFPRWEDRSPRIHLRLAALHVLMCFALARPFASRWLSRRAREGPPVAGFELDVVTRHPAGCVQAVIGPGATPTCSAGFPIAPSGRLVTRGEWCASQPPSNGVASWRELANRSTQEESPPGRPSSREPVIAPVAKEAPLGPDGPRPVGSLHRGAP